MDLLPDLIPTLITSPWLLVIVMTACIIDGFFPPMPSEITVVAALSAAIAAGSTTLWAVAIVAVAAVGAVVGDSLAFAAGRQFGVERLRWMRKPRVRRVTGWIARRVHTSPASLVLVGRYIPVGRVAVNALAGASGLRYRRFVVFSAVAGAVWAALCFAVASISTLWLGDPLWSALLGAGVMLALGLGIDRLARLRWRDATSGDHQRWQTVRPVGPSTPRRRTM